MKIVLINGAGGSGKDTVVALTTTYIREKYQVKNVSTIDEVKKIARKMGWDGEKDELGRQFLADLKQAWTNYNNGANLKIFNDIMDLDLYEHIFPKEFVVFIHCREIYALQWFIERFINRNISVCTLLITRSNIDKFSNNADKNVENFPYDMKIINDGSLEELEKECKNLANFIENFNGVIHN